jgi:hypothetical protein
MHEETDHLGNLGADGYIVAAHNRLVIFSNTSIAVLHSCVVQKTGLYTSRPQSVMLVFLMQYLTRRKY